MHCFFNAAAAGNLGQFRTLLLARADVNATDESLEWAGYDTKPCLRTALHHAAMHGATNICKEILANPLFSKRDARRLTGETALHCAVEGGHLEVVKALLPGAKARELNAMPYSYAMGDVTPTALMMAVQNKMIPIVTLLLCQERLDVNVLDNEGRSALFIAVDNADSYMCELLLRHPQIDPNKFLRRNLIHNHSGQSPLHLCILDFASNYDSGSDDQESRNGTARKDERNRILRMLLQRHDVEVNIVNCDGDPPLHSALQNENLTACKLLLQRTDLNPNLCNSKGETALQAIASFLTPDSIARDSCLFLIFKALLRRSDVDVSVLDKQGCTVLNATKHGPDVLDYIDAAFPDCSTCGARWPRVSSIFCDRCGVSLQPLPSGIAAACSGRDHEENLEVDIQPSSRKRGRERSRLSKRDVEVANRNVEARRLGSDGKHSRVGIKCEPTDLTESRGCDQQVKERYPFGERGCAVPLLGRCGLPPSGSSSGSASDERAPSGRVVQHVAPSEGVSAKIESDNERDGNNPKHTPLSLPMKLKKESKGNCSDVLATDVSSEMARGDGATGHEKAFAPLEDECEDDALVTRVVLKDSAGNPIDFGDGPLTTTGLLDIIAKQFKERNVKFEYTQPKPPREEMVEVQDLLSHHDSIAHCFRDGSSFESLINKLGRQGPAWPLSQRFLKLDAVEWPGWGKIVINNRRLHCLREHQKKVAWTVRIRVRVFSLPKSFVDLIESAPIYWKFMRGFTTWNGKTQRVRRPPPAHASNFVARRAVQGTFDIARGVAADDSIRPEDSISNAGADTQIHAPDISSHLSTVSQCSHASLVSAGGTGRCFLSQALLKTPEGHFVPVGSLSVGEIVCSCTGATLLVKSLKVHDSQEHDLIHLQTNSASLTVTSTHRVIVQRGKDKQTLPARSLQCGDPVYCSEDKVEVLIRTEHKVQVAEVVEVTFFPDEPIEAFQPLSPAIQSKGQGNAKTTRRPKHRRWHRTDSGHSFMTDIPRTEDGFSD